MIPPGTVVRMDSFTSEKRQCLNGSLAIVLRSVDGGARYEVKPAKLREYTRNEKRTLSIDAKNLIAVRKLPLATGPYRGVIMKTSLDAGDAYVICELLQRETCNHHVCAESQLRGFALMMLNEIPQEYRMMCSKQELENYAAIIGLAGICEHGGVEATMDCLLGLCQGNPMYMDVLCLSVSNTEYIGPLEKYLKGCLFRAHCKSYPHSKRFQADRVSPDQDHIFYIKFMNIGPLAICREMMKYNFRNAFFASIQRSDYFHLLIVKMLRIIARETLGKSDGFYLGQTCRVLLPYMLLDYSSVVLDDQGNYPSLLSNEAKLIFEKKLDQMTAKRILSTVDSVIKTKKALKKVVFDELLFI